MPSHNDSAATGRYEKVGAALDRKRAPKKPARSAPDLSALQPALAKLRFTTELATGYSPRPLNREEATAILDYIHLLEQQDRMRERALAYQQRGYSIGAIAGNFDLSIAETKRLLRG